MIALVRPECPNSLLLSRRVRAAREAARHFYESPIEERRQKRHQFDLGVVGVPDVRDALSAMSFGKCSYCESRPLASKLNRDYFRPIGGARGLSGGYFPEHYWWLAYDWENIFGVCAACNISKSNNFPIAAERCRIGATGAALDAEEPLLLDPTRDRPDEHLWADINTGLLAARSDRGRATIGLLNLNRPELVDERRVAVADTQLLVRATFTQDREDLGLALVGARTMQQFLDGIKVGTETYSAFRRAAVDALIFRTFPKLGPQPTPDNLVEDSSGTHYIESITLHNFRGIDDLQIAVPEVSETGAPWTMIIGENGVGKSTILQAIALTLDAASGRTSNVVDQWATSVFALKRGKTNGFVEIRFTGLADPSRIEFDAESAALKYSGPDNPQPIAAYGSTRLISQGNTNVASRSHVANLFDPYKALVAPVPWLLSRDEVAFDLAARVLRDILMLSDDDNFSQSEDNVNVTLGGAPLTFDDLSDGYRATSAMVLDVIAFLQQRYPLQPIDSVSAIVLIDEIGANLHPRWKMRVVNDLRKALPFVQIFATTHDPLCLRGCGNDEVVVLRRIGGRPSLINDLPPIDGLRIDQLLTSEFFGLNSTLDPELEVAFERYYTLLAKTAPTLAETAEAEELAKCLEPITLPGLSRRERLVLQYVDRFIARSDLVENDKQATEDLKAETEERLQNALQIAITKQGPNNDSRQP